LGIGHIELYASQRVSMVDYFRSAFGFAATARKQTEDADSTLVATEFLDQHGDGVADIAFILH
jgi:hypothetical protein